MLYILFVCRLHLLSEILSDSAVLERVFIINFYSLNQLNAIKYIFMVFAAFGYSISCFAFFALFLLLVTWIIIFFQGEGSYKYGRGDVSYYNALIQLIIFVCFRNCTVWSVYYIALGKWTLGFQINSHRANIFMAKAIITVGISVDPLNKEERRGSEILSHFEVDSPNSDCDRLFFMMGRLLCQFNIMQITYYQSCVRILLINPFITWQVMNIDYWLCIWNKHFLS